jgi:hypothetical protein
MEMKTYSLIQLTKSVMFCSVNRCDSNGAKDHAGRVVRSLQNVLEIIHELKCMNSILTDELE